MSASSKLTAKLTGLDYSDKIVACGISRIKTMPQIENSDDLQFIAIIRFFAYPKDSRDGFRGRFQKLTF